MANACESPLIRRPRQTTTARRQSQPGRYADAWSSSPTEPKAHLRPPVFARLSDAPEELIVRAGEKYGWIQGFVDAGCPRGELLNFANRHAASRGLPPDVVPRYTTLNTWVHRYLAFGRVGLLDTPRGDAGQSRTVVGEDLKLFELLATAGERSAAAITARIADLRASTGRMPSEMAIYRALKQFERQNPHLTAAARNGLTALRHQYRLALSHGVLPGGVRLGLDSTVADIWARIYTGLDEDRANGGWRPIRPVLTVVEDLGSRLCVSFNLSILRIDSGICKAVLGRAINQRANYPGLRSVGWPREIAVDKGAEHQGGFMALLKRANIALVKREANNPESGAHVERLIGTITREVFRTHLASTRMQKLFDPYAPPESDGKRTMVQAMYDPERGELPVSALPTLEELEAKLLAWATLYNDRPHSGLPVNDPRIRRLISTEANRSLARQVTAPTQRQDEEVA